MKPSDMPQRRPVPRETFLAFAVAPDRGALHAAMRAEAVAYFGGPVEMQSCEVKRCDVGGYRGSSRWAPTHTTERNER